MDVDVVGDKPFTQVPTMQSPHRTHVTSYLFSHPFPRTGNIVQKAKQLDEPNMEAPQAQVEKSVTTGSPFNHTNLATVSVQLSTLSPFRLDLLPTPHRKIWLVLPRSN